MDVMFEQGDGSVRAVPIEEAIRLNMLDGLKVEIQGTGIVVNPEGAQDNG